MKKLLLMLLILVTIVTAMVLTSCGHECAYTVEVTESSIPATCRNSGTKVMKCSECENTKNEIVPALGHDYISTVVEPTCKAEGYTTQACSRCGDTNGDAKLDKKQPTGNHTYVAVEGSTVKATCTVNGYSLEKCSVCGQETKVNVVVAEGHDFQEMEIYNNNIAPTCTTGAEGVLTKRCTVCNEKDQSFKDVSKQFPALGHDIPHDDAHRISTDAATCTSAQHDKWKCSRCTHTEEADIGTALGHDRTVDLGISAPATCYSLEKRTFECSRKGQPGCSGTPEQGEITEERAIPNTYAPHRMGPAATCVTSQVCADCQNAPNKSGLGTNCDKTNPNCTNCSNINRIHVFEDPTGRHDYKDYDANNEFLGTYKDAQRVGEVVAPTCMRQGYTVYKCTVCEKDDFKDNYTDIVSTSHNVDFDTPLGAPTPETCNKHEFTIHACVNTAEDGTRCTHTEENVYGTTYADHKFADGEPTGVITCTHCQKSFYDTTYVESVYYEYVKVEDGEGDYKKVETYVAAEGGKFVYDDGTSSYRLATDGETGTHNLVVSFEKVGDGESGDYNKTVWNGENGTAFDDNNTNLNVTITVSKSSAKAMGLTGNEEKEQVSQSAPDTTKISIIRIVTDDEDAIFVITVNGTEIEHTGNGFIDLCEYDEITSLKVKSTSLDGEATVYFYGEDPVPDTSNS